MLSLKLTIKYQTNKTDLVYRGSKLDRPGKPHHVKPLNPPNLSSTGNLTTLEPHCGHPSTC